MSSVNPQILMNIVNMPKGLKKYKHHAICISPIWFYRSKQLTDLKSVNKQIDVHEDGNRDRDIINRS